MSFLFDKLGDAFHRFSLSIPNYQFSPYGGAVQADGISSANTVGYSTQNVVAGQFYMVAVQFSDVGATDVANFNNFLSTTCAPGEYGDGMDTTMKNAPQIQVLNANGLTYTMYYYISDAYDSNDNPVSGNCWADDGGYMVNAADVLALSKGFWFKAMTAGTITASGQVSATTEISNSPTANQFNIVANPYPVALGLNAADTTGFTAGEYGDGMDTTMKNAPQIQVLNANGLTYTMYYYISDAYDSNDNPVSGNCWADDGGYIATGTQVPVGQSFWVKSASAGTFTFGL
ncbi:MAG: hypothetical protein IJ658_10420 [Kiritimatiellae bacterium]|nr:hypothetical protein [Kiritimatiellia bacterium]